MDYDIKYVALYLRKSRAESIDDLDKHKTVLVDLCSKYKLKYVEYIEVGTSDSIDMRPKMLQLLRDVEADVYDAVVVVEYDRLGRGDLGEQDRIKKAFQKSNTLIITPEKTYNLNDDLDDTYVDFKGLFARQEYKMITKRLRQGKRIGARRGEWTNGTPPYPYEYERYKDKENAKGIVVNDEKLTVYNYIKNEYIAGKSTSQIAVELNLKHIPSPRNGYWNNTTIGRILVDETHLGRIISNKTKGDGHKQKKPNAINAYKVPKSEWVVVENCHEAVKTEEEHELILKMFVEKRKIPSRTKQAVYSLSGLVKCGRCGYSHTFYKKKNGRILMKSCWYTTPLGDKCQNRGVPMDILEDLIVREIQKFESRYILQDDDHEKHIIEGLNLEIKNKEAEEQKIIGAINRVNESYELGDYTREEWIVRRKKWEEEIDIIKDELYSLRKRLKSTSKQTSQSRLNGIKTFLSKISTAVTSQERNRLYRTIIQEVKWVKDGDDMSMHIEYK